MPSSVYVPAFAGRYVHALGSNCACCEPAPGSIGKSFVSTLLAQYLLNETGAVRCFYTDQENTTFTHYEALAVRQVTVADSSRLKRKTMKHQVAQEKTDRVFRPAEAAVKLGIGRATVYRLVKHGLLVAPRKLALGRASGWLESELDAFLERQRLGRSIT